MMLRRKALLLLLGCVFVLLLFLNSWNRLGLGQYGAHDSENTDAKTGFVSKGVGKSRAAKSKRKNKGNNKASSCVPNRKYDVHVEKHVVYGKGLYFTKNRSNPQRPDTGPKQLALTLDLYTPKKRIHTVEYENMDGEEVKTMRPAMLLIHSGSFVTGNSASFETVDTAIFFASRGWVVASMNYRKCSENGYGNYPDNWDNSILPTSKFESLFNPSVECMYPAVRDGKAAMRWMKANALALGIDPARIVVNGFSAGAVTAVGMALGEEEDFMNEISPDKDPTLKASTNLEMDSKPFQVVVHWGGGYALEMLKVQVGIDRFESAKLQKLPSMIVFHGDRDGVISFHEMDKVEDAYLKNHFGAIYKKYIVKNQGHGIPPKFIINEEKTMNELTYEFVSPLCL